MNELTVVGYLKTNSSKIIYRKWSNLHWMIIRYNKTKYFILLMSVYSHKTNDSDLSICHRTVRPIYRFKNALSNGIKWLKFNTSLSKNNKNNFPLLFNISCFSAYFLHYHALLKMKFDELLIKWVYKGKMKLLTLERQCNMQSEL